MKKNHLFILLLICLFGVFTKAAAQEEKSPLQISGYAEVYYLYDFNEPGNHKLPDFLYSYNRHNEVNLNLGFIKAAYAKDRVRANMALMAGTYTNANLAGEPGVFKNIFEANAGIKISKKHEVWVDAGIFPSHIGFESAIGKDCWTLTRSLLAENSPYYESGAKLSFTTDNGKVLLSALVLNGWQHIQRPEGNNTLCFGHQLTIKPNDKITLNSSSFIGNDQAGGKKLMRYFHNLYGQFQVVPKLGLTAGLDFGAQETEQGSGKYNTWVAPIIILKITPTAKTALAVRAEKYVDKNQVIIATNTRNGFQVIGYSINFDYAVTEHAVWRAELRTLSSKDNIFVRDDKPINTFVTFSTAIAVSF
ncbi:MAG: porin [Bacteroidota bacterium]